MTPTLELDYQAFVHRARASEAFVVSAAELSAGVFDVLLRVPASSSTGQGDAGHHYFGDGIPGGAVADDLFLQEAARQACTLIVHAFHGLPMDHSFLVRSWSYRPGIAPAESATHVRATVTTSNPQHRKGNLTRLTSHVALGLTAHDDSLGRVEVDATYLERTRYAALRSHGRQTPAPLSSELPPRDDSGLPRAELVGRVGADNVLIDATDAGGMTLSIPFEHQTFFDHPLDHVTMLLAVEAARQRVLFDCDPAPAGDAVRLGYDVTFPGMLELDSPITLSRREESPTTIAFEQSGVTRAVVTVTDGYRL